MIETTAHWPEIALEPLETRVGRLEAVVTSLQDTQALEDRIVERVRVRLDAERPTLMETAEKAMHIAAGPDAPPLPRSTWLLFDLYREGTAIFRMFFDLHYHVGWTTRMLVLVLLPAILLSNWWLPFAQIWVLGNIVVQLVNLVLAF